MPIVPSMSNYYHEICFPHNVANVCTKLSVSCGRREPIVALELCCHGESSQQFSGHPLCVESFPWIFFASPRDDITFIIAVTADSSRQLGVWSLFVTSEGVQPFLDVQPTDRFCIS